MIPIVSGSLMAMIISSIIAASGGVAYLSSFGGVGVAGGGGTVANNPIFQPPSSGTNPLYKGN